MVPGERESGGLRSLFTPAEGPSLDTPLREPIGKDPLYGPARTRPRVRRGLGEPGLQRIREDLLEFKEPTSDEEPPEEPPVGDAEVPSPLPPPEEIHPIAQSTKGGFSTPRPDRHVEFWKAAKSKQSTRVASAQWIPTEESKVGITGDLFIAFARPHEGKSTLFLYKGVNDSQWSEFKGTDSFGKFIPRLGEYSAHSEVVYKYYKYLHPDQVWWIFNESWTIIRENNESVTGEKAPRGVAARTASTAAAIASQRKRERESGA